MRVWRRAREREEEMGIGVLAALEGDGIERREARVSEGERLGWA